MMEPGKAVSCLLPLPHDSQLISNLRPPSKRRAAIHLKKLSILVLLFLLLPDGTIYAAWISRFSTPRASKSPAPNMDLGAQDQQKNPKSKGLQWDLRTLELDLRFRGGLGLSPIGLENFKGGLSLSPPQNLKSNSKVLKSHCKPSDFGFFCWSWAPKSIIGAGDLDAGGVLYDQTSASKSAPNCHQQVS